MTTAMMQTATCEFIRTFGRTVQATICLAYSKSCRTTFTRFAAMTCPTSRS